MGEVKNAFIKSKMNKDLDARLIPSGEYRNAVNVQVSKSEGSSVGSLENVLGNTLVVDFQSLTGVSGLVSIGYIANELDNTIYMFLTDNTTGVYVPGTSGEVGSNHFIISYNTLVLPGVSANILVSGAFLNFSTKNRIYGINVIEDLLFWTDNSNQPRKINISNATGNYYSTEDQISVSKYNPFKSIELYRESELVTGDYETTMYDVVSKFYPGGGTGNVLVALASSSTTVDVDKRTINGNLLVGDTIAYVDPSTNVLVDTGATVASIGFVVGSPNTIRITCSSAIGPLLFDQELIFNFNPYYDATYNGDPNFLEDKFVRFAYRFQFEDGEYSIFSPFTQTAFIPKQDGYFLYDQPLGQNPYNIDVDDEAAAYRSTIVEFMENKVNKTVLVIPLPFLRSEMASDGTNPLKITSVDILFKESDALAVKVIDTIDMRTIKDQTTRTTIYAPDSYAYNYQSKKPFKTLPSSDLIRVYDKVPVRALGQEIISNRVVYSNFQNKHTPPDNIDYNLLISEKASFDLNISTITTSSETTNSATIQYTLNAGSPSIIEGGLLVGAGVVVGTKIISFTSTALLTDTVQTSIANNRVLTVAPVGQEINTTSIIEYPNHSLKQNRNYQVGIILSDRFGRTSSVILSNSLTSTTVGGTSYKGSTIYSSYNAAGTDSFNWPGDSLKVLFNSALSTTQPNLTTNEPGVYNGDVTSSSYNPLGWYSYKIVVKQTEQEYYNVYLPGVMAAYPNDTTLELGKTSFAVLLGDNINKIPRDLTEVGPQQRQFRSSVQLFGRVENTTTAIPIGNTQYFPSRSSFTVSTIATDNDLFNGEDLANYQPTNDFYEIESNPLIAKISTNKKFGVVTDSASATLSTAISAVVTIPGLVEVKGIIKVGDIVTGENVTDNTGVVSVTGNPVTSISVTGAQTLPVRTILTFNDPEPVYNLAVFETAPVESNLDIFWETSSSGIVSELNNFILNDSNGASGIGNWNVSGFSESKEAPQKVTNTPFNVLDNFGSIIPYTGTAGATVVVESLTLTSVQTLEDIPVEVFATTNSIDSRFTLVNNNEDAANPTNTWDVKTVIPLPLNNPSFDWIYGNNADKNKSFVFNFTIVTKNVASGETFTANLIEYAALDNASPSFTTGNGDPATCPTVETVGSTSTTSFKTFFGTNGAFAAQNGPVSPYSFVPGIYQGLTFSVQTADSDGNIVSNAFVLTDTNWSSANPNARFRTAISRASTFSTAGTYTVTVTLSDAGNAVAICTFSVILQDDSCVTTNKTCTCNQTVNYIDCNGQPAVLNWNPIDANVTKVVSHLFGTTPSECIGQGQCFCFLAENEVEMFDGSFKAISKIIKGDKVKSIIKGKIVEGVVTDTLRHSIHDDQRVVNINGITAESNHPVFVDGKWIPIADLGTTVEMFIEDFYNLEIDGDIEESEHNFTIGGLVVSGLGDNIYLNNKYQRQPKHLTAWLEGNNNEN